MFNFKNLIKKYSKTPVYLLEQTEGHYDYSQGGIWVPGTITEVEKQGAVLPLTNEDLKYDEGGTYTTQDKKLYTYNDFEVGSKIKHKDLEYTIQEKQGYEEFDNGLNIYWCRRAGG
jgi:hypothetical protein